MVLTFIFDEIIRAGPIRNEAVGLRSDVAFVRRSYRFLPSGRLLRRLIRLLVPLLWLLFRLLRLREVDQVPGLLPLLLTRAEIFQTPLEALLRFMTPVRRPVRRVHQLPRCLADLFTS